MEDLVAHRKRNGIPGFLSSVKQYLDRYIRLFHHDPSIPFFSLYRDADANKRLERPFKAPREVP